MRRSREDDGYDDELYPPLNAVDPWYYRAQLPEISITENEWHGVLKYCAFPSANQATARHRIHETICRFVKLFELYSRRAEYNQIRKDTFEQMQKALSHVNSFIKIQAIQPQYGMTDQKRGDDGTYPHFYDLDKDALKARESIELFSTALKMFMLLPPRDLPPGRNNKSIFYLVRAVDDIVRRQTAYGPIRRSLKSRSDSTVQSSVERRYFADLAFVRAILELGLEKAKPFVGPEEIKITKNMDRFVAEMIDTVRENESGLLKKKVVYLPNLRRVRKVPV